MREKRSRGEGTKRLDGDDERCDGLGSQKHTHNNSHQSRRSVLSIVTAAQRRATAAQRSLSILLLLKIAKKSAHRLSAVLTSLFEKITSNFIAFYRRTRVRSQSRLQNAITPSSNSSDTGTLPLTLELKKWSTDTLLLLLLSNLLRNNDTLASFPSYPRAASPNMSKVPAPAASSSGGGVGPSRRTWDKDTFERKAMSREKRQAELDTSTPNVDPKASPHSKSSNPINPNPNLQCNNVADRLISPRMKARR